MGATQNGSQLSFQQAAGPWASYCSQGLGFPLCNMKVFGWTQGLQFFKAAECFY